jgi:hypothetical protein
MDALLVAWLSFRSKLATAMPSMARFDFSGRAMSILQLW